MRRQIDIARIIKEISLEFGENILKDKSRVIALLEDRMAGMEKEKRLMILLVREGIAEKLLSMKSGYANEQKLMRLECRTALMEEHFLSEAWADYGVNCFCMALDFTDGQPGGGQKISEIDLPEPRDTSSVKQFDEWFALAESGSPEAQLFLFSYYQYSDPAQAIEWCTKAAESGYAAAQVELGDCFMFGRSVPKDESKAFYWYERAADQGHVDDPGTQYFLAMSYYDGKYTVTDKRKAFEWFYRAANQGLDRAQYDLSYCYTKGIGVNVNDRKAIKWLKKAAKQNHATAQYALGKFYYNGIGTDKDDSKAIKWLKRSADQGNGEAAELLRKIY